MSWSGSREWALGIGMGCALRRTQIDGLGNNSKLESYEKPPKTLHNSITAHKHARWVLGKFTRACFPEHCFHCVL